MAESSHWLTVNMQAMRMNARAVFLLVALGCVSASALAQSTIPTTIHYGSEPTSFGELTVPSGDGPFPVVVLIHGGCWRSDRGSVGAFRPTAEALEGKGIATWNIEYRRVGHEGGGWPGTLLDLGEAVDFLPSLADSYSLDLERIVLLGHSSGGHFAAWLAVRPLLPQSSEIRGEPLIDIAGVVMADAYIDPMVIDSTGVDGVLYCGEPLLERLIGGRPDTHPEQLRQISPIDWLPWGLRQEYIISSRRYPVTPPRPLADGRTTMRMLDYPELSRGTGDPINVEIISDADHFDFTTPDTEAFEAVELAVLRVLESRDWAVVD